MDEEEQENRVVKFLMGLNDGYNVIRSNIFAMKQVPGIDVVYDMVFQEETQRKEGMSAHIESAAMYGNVKQWNYNTRESHNPPRGGGRRFNNDRDKVVCSHCHLPGHTKERCYKLIGYPPGFKNKERNETQAKGNIRYLANNITNVSDNDCSSIKFTNEQIGQMLSQLLLKSGNEQALPTRAEKSAEKNELYMAGTVQACTVFIERNCWVIDSGATSHFTYNAELLKNISRLENPYTVKLPNGEKLVVKYCGTCVLNGDLILYDVLYVPEFKVNLISVSKMIEDSDVTLSFDKTNCIVQGRASKIIVKTGEPEEGLYQTKTRPSVSSLSARAGDSNLELWHHRLGHAPFETINKLLKQSNISLRDNGSNCMTCPLAKQTKLPFPLNSHGVSSIFDLVHGEVWGPFGVESISGYRYFLTLVDDFSRGTWTYLMKQKSEVTSLITSFITMVATQFGKTVRILWIDNGGEFFTKQMIDFLQTKGCIHQSSCAYTPQQNGVVNESIDTCWKSDEH